MPVLGLHKGTHVLVGGSICSSLPKSVCSGEEGSCRGKHVRKVNATVSILVPTNPKVYAEHNAARAAACRGYHTRSLQELLHTI
jgi:hypothetical protein